LHSDSSNGSSTVRKLHTKTSGKKTFKRNTCHLLGIAHKFTQG
jgi:hypothetical protein